jgi:hypothetical protein
MPHLEPRRNDLKDLKERGPLHGARHELANIGTPRTSHRRHHIGTAWHTDSSFLADGQRLIQFYTTTTLSVSGGRLSTRTIQRSAEIIRPDDRGHTRWSIHAAWRDEAHLPDSSGACT